MTKIKTYIGSVLLTGVLAMPVVVLARPQDDHHEETAQQKRVYDSSHKQYHNWDGNEDKAWRQYQTDNHQKYRDYGKANKKDQSAYWSWRQDHPDAR